MNSLHEIATLPGPRAWPLVGRLHQNVEAWGREFGPLFRFRLGPRTPLSCPTMRHVRTRADRQLARSVAEVNAAIAGFIVQARERLAAEPARRGASNRRTCSKR